MEFFPLFVAFLTAFAAAFVGTNTGGGAFIVTPVLIFLGLPPHAAVACHRVGVIVSVAMGMLRFHQDKKIRFDVGIPVVFFASIGAIIGANIMLVIPEELFRRIIGAGILLMLVLVLMSPRLGVEASHHRFTRYRYFGYPLFICSSAFAAILGGSGVFARMIYLTFFGFTMSEASGTSKIVTLTLSIVASIIFIRAGIVDWPFTIALMFGGGLGSYTGAHVGLKKGDAWVRKLFLVIVLVLALRLLL